MKVYIHSCCCNVVFSIPYTVNVKNLLFYTKEYFIHWITLRYITLHYITLHYITLHYITLHYLFLYLLSFTFHRSLEINPLDIGIVIYKQNTLNMYRNTLISIQLS